MPDEPTQSRRDVLDYPTTTAAREVPGKLRLLLGPQSGWMVLLALGLLMLLIWEQRFPDSRSTLAYVSVIGMMVLGVWWAIRVTALLIIAAIYRVQPHPLTAGWRRWIIVPALFLFGGWTIHGDWPSRAAFAWHREQMQQIADEVLLDHDSHDRPTRVGMYDFDHIRYSPIHRSVDFYASQRDWAYAFSYSPLPHDGNIDQHWSSWSHD